MQKTDVGADDLSKLSRRKIKVKRNILANLKRAGLDTYVVCRLEFKENDTIVSNSLRKRYCLTCAIRLNIAEE